MCRTLIGRGVAVCLGLAGGVGAGKLLLDGALLRAAAAEAHSEHAVGRLAPSCVKSAATNQPTHYTDGTRRGDLVRWLDGAQPALPALSALTQWLRSELLDAISAACAQAPAGTNSGAGAAPFLRLERPGTLPPAMLACYPGRGAQFERHLDNSPATPDSRVVTAVLYLNPDWIPANGGLLRLYPLAGPSEDVEPTLGALALFWSHRVEHEVLPAHAPRYALSLWISVAPDQPAGWRNSR
jgi:SM-20-related protein